MCLATRLVATRALPTVATRAVASARRSGPRVAPQHLCTSLELLFCPIALALSTLPYPQYPTLRTLPSVPQYSSTTRAGRAARAGAPIARGVPVGHGRQAQAEPLESARVVSAPSRTPRVPNPCRPPPLPARHVTFAVCARRRHPPSASVVGTSRGIGRSRERAGTGPSRR